MGNPFELHRTIERLFSAYRGTDGRLQERVLYRLDVVKDVPKVLIQSVNAPDWEAHHKMYPDYHARTPWTKEIAPQFSFSKGQIWRYRCRVNVCVLGHRPDGRPCYNGVYYAENQVAWWKEKASKLGFKVLSAIPRPDKPNFKASKKRKLTFSVATFDGFLEVCDKELFEKTFQKGIGRGKAYGFGMLSLLPGDQA